MNDKNNKKDNGKLPKSSQTILLLAIAVMFTLFVMSAYSSMTNKDNQNISYTKLMELAQAGDVESVYVNNSSSRLEIKLTKEASKKIYQEEASKSGISESASSKLLDAANTKQIVYYAGIPADADFYNKMEQYKVDVSDSIPDTNSAILDFLLIYILPILIFWFFLMFIMKRAGGGGVMGVGKSNAKMYIQKETGVTSERAKVASVFVNRLNLGMKLQTDPTVIYAVTKGEMDLGRPLYKKDLTFDSPYNTYVYEGLPPQPICSPGKEALYAAAHPATTKYLYFVADGITGGHRFAKSLKEHNDNVIRYRRLKN